MGRVRTTLLLLAAVILQTQELPQQDKELPQLSKDIEGRTESSTDTSVTVSFLQWNNQMIGELPPTNHKVKINGVTKLIPYNPNTERVNQTFNNLLANTEYTVEVGCQIRDDDCPGPIQTFKTCTAINVLIKPSTPVAKSYTCTEEQHDGRQRWKCTFTWQDNNCPGSVNYTITGTNINKETSSHSADVYLDGNQRYLIIVEAKNSVSRESDPAYFPNRTDQLAPQFGSSTFTVTESNSTCVKLTWQRPEYPGGYITSYQYKCAAGGWSSSRSLSTLSCGHQPYTNIKCYLKALNNLESVEITANGSTFCAAPESPSYSMMSYRGQNEKADLSIDLNESAPHCQYIRHYIITVKNEDGSIVHEQTYNRHGKFNITGLDRFTVYTVMVQVFNNEGLTSSSSRKIITAENGLLSNGEYFQLGAPAEGSLTVELMLKKVTLKNLEVSAYFVLVAQQARENQATMLQTCSEKTITNPQPGLTDQPEGCYVTAKISADEIKDTYTLNIGDGKEYGGFYNRPLEDGADYLVYLMVQATAESDSEMLIQSSSPLSFNVKLKNGDSAVGVIKSSKTGALAGAVIGWILLALFHPPA